MLFSSVQRYKKVRTFFMFSLSFVLQKTSVLNDRQRVMGHQATCHILIMFLK